MTELNDDGNNARRDFQAWKAGFDQKPEKNLFTLITRGLDHDTTGTKNI